MQSLKIKLFTIKVSYNRLHILISCYSAPKQYCQTALLLLTLVTQNLSTPQCRQDHLQGLLKDVL